MSRLKENATGPIRSRNRQTRYASKGVIVSPQSTVEQAVTGVKDVDGREGYGARASARTIGNPSARQFPPKCGLKSALRRREACTFKKQFSDAQSGIHH